MVNERAAASRVKKIYRPPQTPRIATHFGTLVKSSFHASRATYTWLESRACQPPHVHGIKSYACPNPFGSQPALFQSRFYIAFVSFPVPSPRRFYQTKAPSHSDLCLVASTIPSHPIPQQPRKRTPFVRGRYRFPQPCYINIVDHCRRENDAASFCLLSGAVETAQKCKDTTVAALPWTPNRRRRRRGISWVRGRFAGIPRSPLPRRKATRRRTKSSVTYRGWRGTNKRLELTLPGGQQSLRWVYTRSGAGVATRRTGLRWQVLPFEKQP